MNKKNLEKYFSEAKESTSTGEHLFVLNTLLFEIVKNYQKSEVDIHLLTN